MSRHCRIEEEAETYHAACVGRRDTVDQSPPDIEVFAVSALRISTAVIAQVSTGVDIILVNESKAHVLSKLLASET